MERITASGHHSRRTPDINLNTCGWGTIIRKFQAWQHLPSGDANSNGAIDANEILASNNTCNQVINIVETHQYSITFPADSVAFCNDPVAEEVTFSTTGCDVLVMNTSAPQRFSAVGDECYLLNITYDVINWCTWDGESEGYTIPRFTDTDDNLVDECERPVVSVTDAGAFIDRNHPHAGCSSDLPDNFPIPANANVGRWKYTRFVKVYDVDAPPNFRAALWAPQPVPFRSGYVWCLGRCHLYCLRTAIF
ncbi:MAG: hypothetical protein R2795_08865 [Saprospiraceae bacterium]